MPIWEYVKGIFYAHWDRAMRPQKSTRN